MNSSTLVQHYRDVVTPALKKTLGITNMHAVPKVTAVVINVGTSQALKDPKYLDTIASTLSRISGQKAIPRPAKKSIAAFKIREGQVVGMKVTLRGKRMYDFLHKLIAATFPRMRDFHGIPATTLDAQGNMSFGFPEHMVFPEIRPDEIERVHGVQITVVTNAATRAHAFELFKLLGFPFSAEGGPAIMAEKLPLGGQS